MIILDDDIIAALPSPATRTPAFGTANSRRLAFFDNQKTAITSPKSGAQSPLRLTEAVLGSSLGALLTQQQADTDSLRGAVGDDWFDLAGTARVAVTQRGTFGEPGTGTRAHWIINLAPEDIEALLSQPDPIEQTLAKQAMWMGYPSQTVTRLSSMSAVTGLDHRELLPPHFPACGRRFSV